jgi:Mor family transcriptional regulator
MKHDLPGELTYDLLKMCILDYVDLNPAISHSNLILKLEANFLTAKNDDILKAISEHVQAKQIIRFEFSLPNVLSRRAIYFPAGTKLALS